MTDPEDIQLVHAAVVWRNIQHKRQWDTWGAELSADCMSTSLKF